MSRTKRLFYGLVVTIIVLLSTEAFLWLAALTTGRDLRVDPLPAPADYPVLCAAADGQGVKLCPDRGPEYERVRPLAFSLRPDRPRVVTIGESFVYGLGLEAEEAWPARLEAALAGKAEVLNLGRCGTYASRLQPQVAAAETLHADVVILSVGNNEHTMTSFFSGPLGRHPLKTYEVMRTAGQSQLFGLLSRIVTGGQPLRAAESFDTPAKAITDPVDAQVYAARRRPPDLSLFPEGHASQEVTRILEEEQRLKERIFEGHLRRMVRTAQAGGATVVLTTLPWRLGTAPALSGTQSADPANVRRIVDRVGAPGDPDPEAAYREGLALDPTVAGLHHQAGRMYLRTQRPGPAADAFRQAAEWDLVPDATPSINAIIARVAAEEGATLVDLHALSDGWMAAPDSKLLDKVHVSAGGAEDVAQALVDPVRAALKAR